MPGINRRTVLGWTAAAPLIALVGCSTTQPQQTSSPSPAPPTPTATPAGSPTAKPLPEPDQRAFGPDGSHWPENTPRPHDDVREVRVDCSWEAIGTALAAVTPRQAAEGTRLLIAPGTLGVGTTRDVLSDLGDPSWERNVLIIPREGRDSVRMTGETRIRGVRGVTFARFDADFVGLANCTRTNWAHSRLSQGLRVYAEDAHVTQCNIYEAVVPEMKVDEQDPFAYVAGGTGSLNDCVWEGCYAAPIYRPKGSRAHLDTLQLFGNAPYRGLTLRDCALFGSHNSALQLGGVTKGDPDEGTPFVTLDHTLLVSQQAASRTRYQMPSGAEAPALDQVINGAGEPGQLHAHDSLVVGTLYTTQWGEVRDSYVSSERATKANAAQSGGWKYEPELAELSSAYLDRICPAPDDAYLASIWA